MWIIDDFRINFNKIKKMYDDFLSKQSQYAFDNFIKPMLLKDSSIRNVDITNLSKNQYKETVFNGNYSEFEKTLFAEKMFFLSNYKDDFIPFQLQFGTQSDFIYRSSFVYIVSMFEGFNRKLIEIFEKFYPVFFFIKKKRIKVYYNPNSINKLFKKQFKIFNLKKEIPFYQKLIEYYIIRNIIVHNLGFVNDKFIKKIKNKKYQKNQKINITDLEFNELVDMVLKYLIFIKKKIEDWVEK